MSYYTNQPISAEDIYLSLKQRIIKLELEPGQKISENTICEEYGVSRSVIRTVFTRLQQIRLIAIYPQRGTYVSMIDLNYIRDVLMLRTSVEKEILFEIFRDVKGDDFKRLVDRLEENVKKQEHFSETEFYSSDFQELDEEFHKIMMDSVKRFAIVEMIDNLLLHIDRWRNFDVPFAKRGPHLVEQHIQIVGAIKNHDLARAHEIMSEHLATVSDIADRVKVEYPHFFL